MMSSRLSVDPSCPSALVIHVICFAPAYLSFIAAGSDRASSAL